MSTENMRKLMESVKALFEGEVVQFPDKGYIPYNGPDTDDPSKVKAPGFNPRYPTHDFTHSKRGTEIQMHDFADKLRNEIPNAEAVIQELDAYYAKLDSMYDGVTSPGPKPGKEHPADTGTSDGGKIFKHADAILKKHNVPYSIHGLDTWDQFLVVAPRLS